MQKGGTLKPPYGFESSVSDATLDQEEASMQLIERVWRIGFASLITCPIHALSATDACCAWCDERENKENEDENENENRSKGRDERPKKKESHRLSSNGWFEQRVVAALTLGPNAV